MSDTQVTRLHPKTADSQIRRALKAGLDAMRYQPPHGVGLAMCATENDAREGRTHTARPLDIAITRAHASGVPLWGPEGAMQIVDRLRAALLEMWGERVTTDVQSASEAEAGPDSALDMLQARRQDQLSRAELQRGAALGDEVSYKARVYADACRARITEMDAAERAWKTRKADMAGSAA